MSGQFVCGIHAVAALLANPNRRIQRLFINQERVDEKIKNLLTQAQARSISLEKLTKQQMNQRFLQLTHQGVVAEVAGSLEYDESDLIHLLAVKHKPHFILILDGITDPHNLGACLRSADAAGVDFVVIPKDRSASISAVVSKVASGAAESIPVVRVTNLVRAMEWLKEQGVWIYGADASAKQWLYQMDCSGSIALVMGSEGEGLRRLTKEHCDHLFSIPMLGAVSSLNVSVASGISLFEVVRQRSQYEQHE